MSDTHNQWEFSFKITSNVCDFIQKKRCNCQIFWFSCANSILSPSVSMCMKWWMTRRCIVLYNVICFIQILNFELYDHCNVLLVYNVQWFHLVDDVLVVRPCNKLGFIIGCYSRVCSLIQKLETYYFKRQSADLHSCAINSLHNYMICPRLHNFKQIYFIIQRTSVKIVTLSIFLCWVL